MFVRNMMVKMDARNRAPADAVSGVGDEWLARIAGAS